MLSEKRVALQLTGAGGGIGRQFAMQLAKLNMDIVVHYNGNRAKAEETQKLQRRNLVQKSMG